MLVVAMRKLDSLHVSSTRYRSYQNSGCSYRSDAKCHQSNFGRFISVVGSDGRYLFFLSARELQPQYDALLQGMSFPHLERIAVYVYVKTSRSTFERDSPCGGRSYTESFALGDANSRRRYERRSKEEEE